MFLHAPNSAISDLNWGRITPWRELIAQFFDVTEYRPYLVNVNEIEIEHAVIPLPQAQPDQRHAASIPFAHCSWLPGSIHAWAGKSDDDRPQPTIPNRHI